VCKVLNLLMVGMIGVLDCKSRIQDLNVKTSTDEQIKIRYFDHHEFAFCCMLFEIYRTTTFSKRLSLILPSSRSFFMRKVTK